MAASLPHELKFQKLRPLLPSQRRFRFPITYRRAELPYKSSKRAELRHSSPGCRTLSTNNAKGYSKAVSGDRLYRKVCPNCLRNINSPSSRRRRVTPDRARLSREYNIEIYFRRLLSKHREPRSNYLLSAFALIHPLVGNSGDID